ncbi:unnamed protein product, partial [Gadus morhua 'NCC']
VSSGIALWMTAIFVRLVSLYGGQKDTLPSKLSHEQGTTSTSFDSVPNHSCPQCS